MPPLLEYIDSLLTGTGHDLDLRTFKLVDQLSGRMMGLRADITPQVARIDAHLLNREGVTRLCYCGSVLHTRPAGTAATREPIQIGAELYGHAGGRGRRRDPAAPVPRARARRACATRASTSATCGVPLPRARGLERELEAELFARAADEGRAAAEGAHARSSPPRRARRCCCCRSSTAARRCSTPPRRSCRRLPRSRARSPRCARSPQACTPAGELRSRRAARLPLPHRRGVRRLLRWAGPSRPRHSRRARRALRRGRQGLRPRTAGHRILHRPQKHGRSRN